MSLQERERALLALVQRYREEECRTVLEAARAEARRLLADTRRAERARLHARVVAERANARLQIQAARAERDTRARASVERSDARLLDLAWPRLREALLARWRDPARRQLWIEKALGQARAALPAGRWTIRHPADWPPGERAELAAILDRQLGKTPRFLSDGALSAGLVIEVQGAALDSSLEGLLRDRVRLEARLLALMKAVPAEPPEAGA